MSASPSNLGPTTLANAIEDDPAFYDSIRSTSFGANPLQAAPIHATYAALFSGGFNSANNHDRYYEETLRMWQISTALFGVQNVWVLFADGTDNGVDRSSNVDSDWSPITDAGGNIESATHDNLQARLAAIAGLITEDDSFYFWSFNHGENSGFEDCPNAAPNAPNSTVLNKVNPNACPLPDPDVATEDTVLLTGWGAPSIPDDEFAGWVAPINQTSLASAYAFAQCFSGGMADDLFPAPRVFAAWAATWDECSFGKDWADAWADAIESGLRSTWQMGEYARLNDPSGCGPAQDCETPGWTGDNFHFLTNEPVPEPATLILVGGTLASFAGLKLRRKRRVVH